MVIFDTSLLTKTAENWSIGSAQHTTNTKVSMLNSMIK